MYSNKLHLHAVSFIQQPLHLFTGTNQLRKLQCNYPHRYRLSPCLQMSPPFVNTTLCVLFSKIHRAYLINIKCLTLNSIY